MPIASSQSCCVACAGVPEPSATYSLNGGAYTVYPSVSTTWTEARALCSERNLFLASMFGALEVSTAASTIATALRATMPSLPAAMQYWLGLSSADVAASGNFTWPDGEAITYWGPESGAAALQMGFEGAVATAGVSKCLLVTMYPSTEVSSWALADCTAPGAVVCSSECDTHAAI